MSDNVSEKMVSDDSKKIESLQKLVSNCSIYAKTPWLKFLMTEAGNIFWKDMYEVLTKKRKDMYEVLTKKRKDMYEVIDTLIQRCPEKAEVVRRLRSEAREGKAKAASRASQEHTIVDIGGGSLTAQNEPQPNHQGLPVGGDHQFHNVQVNVSTNQTDNYAPESAAMESGRSSTLGDNEPAEHTNIENGGGSSTAQNEPPPNHQGLPVGGNHQFHNGSINQTDNYPPESADMESGRSSTVADNEPAPDNFGNNTVFMVVGEGLSIALAVISAKKGEGEKTIQAKIFLYVLTVFILVGIISLPYGLCLSRAGGRVRGSIVARLVKTVCYVAVGLAVATGAGLQLPSHVMVWVIPLVWGIIAPAIVCYAINQ